MKTRSEELFEKVEGCNYGCIAGSLELNADYIELQVYVRKLEALVEQQKVHLTILDDLGFSVGVNEEGHAYVQHNGFGKRYTLSEEIPEAVRNMFPDQSIHKLDIAGGELKVLASAGPLTGEALVQSLRVRAEEAERAKGQMRSALQLLLDHVDYLSGACGLTEQVGAALPLLILTKARLVLGKGAGHEVP